MKEMTVHEAKAHFSSVLNDVENGEIVVVTRHDRPVAEIRAVSTRKSPVLGAFETPGLPETDVSWSETELDELFGDLLKKDAAPE